MQWAMSAGPSSARTGESKHVTVGAPSTRGHGQPGMANMEQPTVPVGRPSRACGRHCQDHTRICHGAVSVPPYGRRCWYGSRCGRHAGPRVPALAPLQRQGRGSLRGNHPRGTSGGRHCGDDRPSRGELFGGYLCADALTGSVAGHQCRDTVPDCRALAWPLPSGATGPATFIRTGETPCVDSKFLSSFVQKSSHYKTSHRPWEPTADVRGVAIRTFISLADRQPHAPAHHIVRPRTSARASRGGKQCLLSHDGRGDMSTGSPLSVLRSRRTGRHQRACARWPGRHQRRVQQRPAPRAWLYRACGQHRPL